MRTVNEDISTIQSLIKEVNDQSDYSFSELYSLWKQERAVVFRNEITKKYPISMWDIATLCIDVEKVKPLDCANCKEYHLSVKELPRPISGNYTDTFRVRDETGRYIGFTKQTNLLSEAQNPILKNSIRYGILNNKLVLYNNKKLKSVIVEFIPEDPYNDFFDKKCEDASTYMSEDISAFVIRRVLELLGYQKEWNTDSKADNKEVN